MNLSFRYAESSDLETYYAWANDNTVRKYALRKESISLKDHIKWFNQRVNSSNTVMLVFEHNAKTLVGQVRFDVLDDKATIDYSVDKDHRGKGLGHKILKLALEALLIDYPSIKGIEGFVHCENIPSIKVFKRLNFLENRREVVNGEEYYVFIRIV